MGDHYKEYNNLDDVFAAAQIMSKFQRIHNVIRPDFLILLKITEEQKSNEKEFDALYRSCLTRFFTLIEADIYGLNKLDVYDKYDDKKDRFIEKFKETYKQICKTWKKEELQKKYFDSKLEELTNLKKKRDNLVHPKELDHIYKASDIEFNRVKKAFEDYDIFINALMNDFFVGIKLDSSILFK